MVLSSSVNLTWFIHGLGNFHLPRWPSEKFVMSRDTGTTLAPINMAFYMLETNFWQNLWAVELLVLLAAWLLQEDTVACFVETVQGNWEEADISTELVPCDPTSPDEDILVGILLLLVSPSSDPAAIAPARDNLDRNMVWTVRLWKALQYAETLDWMLKWSHLGLVVFFLETF